MLRQSIILLGLGQVGRALLRQIIRQRRRHCSEYGLEIGVFVAGDSSGCLPLESADDEALQGLLAAKEAGLSVARHPEGHASPDPAVWLPHFCPLGVIVVDCTASDATAPALRWALEHGGGIVLANKKPLTQSQERYDQLTWDLGLRLVHRCRWETTVGAGLPVIATLQRLVNSGDRIARVDGAFSGTLGYVMTGLQAGRAFSEVVTDAHAQGYTEPDPRDDLSGLDMARKALILARGMGLCLEMADVAVESLYPASLADLSVPAFMQALPSLDADMQARVAEATARGQRLRYVATVSAEGLAVGPAAVPADSALGQLQGTDNLVQFTSQWYAPQPLVIQGRGAGVEATAAGVLSDIVDLAFSLWAVRA